MFYLSKQISKYKRGDYTRGRTLGGGIIGGHLEGCPLQEENIRATLKSIWRFNIIISEFSVKYIHTHTPQKIIEKIVTKC